MGLGRMVRVTMTGNVVHHCIDVSKQRKLEEWITALTNLSADPDDTRTEAEVILLNTFIMLCDGIILYPLRNQFLDAYENACK